jgi:hypothetical protein
MHAAAVMALCCGVCAPSFLHHAPIVVKQDIEAAQKLHDNHPNVFTKGQPALYILGGTKIQWSGSTTDAHPWQLDHTASPYGCNSQPRGTHLPCSAYMHQVSERTHGTAVTCNIACNSGMNTLRSTLPRPTSGCSWADVLHTTIATRVYCMLCVTPATTTVGTGTGIA